MRSDAPLSSVNVVLVMAYGSLVSLALYYCDAAISNVCFYDDLTGNTVTLLNEISVETGEAVLCISIFCGPNRDFRCQSQKRRK